MKRVLACVWFVGFAAACSDGYDGTCSTVADCAREAEEGQVLNLGLSCVNGQCIRLCEEDSDCRVDPETGGIDPNSRRICVSFACTDGCTEDSTNPCGGGETCGSDYRCSFFREGFEPPPGEQPKLFNTDAFRAACRSKGTDPNSCSRWDELTALGREKQNISSDVAYSGDPGCGAETEPELCAGTPGGGSNFYILSRVPTPLRPGVEFGPTCKACKCCADCLDGDLYFDDDPTCPGVTPNPAKMCTADPKPACDAICNECGQCPDRNPPLPGDGLTECQVRTADKDCQACEAYEACEAMERGPSGTCNDDCEARCAGSATCLSACNRQNQVCVNSRCSTSNSAFCNELVDPPLSACTACQAAQAADPNTPDVRACYQQLCDSLGNLACVSGAIAIVRNQLCEAEQALVSPELDLSQASGNVILEFQYVPFNVAETFTVPPNMFCPRDDSWPQGAQSQLVRVQLCAGDCANEASWQDASFTSGEKAEVPRQDERNNGLTFVQQSVTDWQTNAGQVSIPDAMRTSTFRFRFVPRTADGAIVGLDEIVIRRQP